jgi:broad specificity phosphatase PhoE
MRIPKSESLMDLSERINKFLHQLIKQAEILPSTNSSILVVSHGLFLKELHRVLSSFSVTGPLFGKADVYYPNTGVSQYKIWFDSDKEEISRTECQVYACGEHVK